VTTAGGTAPGGAAPGSGDGPGARVSSCVSRTFRGSRAWQVGARTVHIAAIGLLLGGIAYSAPHGALVVPIALALASGLVLLGIDLWQGDGYFTHGNGMAVLLKLALLGLGQCFPAVRLELYLAATAVASIGSHMPRTWRHWSFLPRRGSG
jgi:hypothetical protein